MCQHAWLALTVCDNPGIEVTRAVYQMLFNSKIWHTSCIGQTHRRTSLNSNEHLLFEVVSLHSSIDCNEPFPAPPPPLVGMHPNMRKHDNETFHKTVILHLLIRIDSGIPSDMEF